MFKKNDIVRNKNVSHLVSKIVFLTKTHYILLNGYHHEKNDGCLELWMPKDGELVVIKDSDENGIHFIVRQFNSSIDKEKVIEPYITFDFDIIEIELKGK